jgi:hypothetical protein
LGPIQREISWVECNKPFGIIVEAKGVGVGKSKIAKIAIICNRRNWKT